MVKEKYSVAECERRFLLEAIPEGAANPRRIIDHYIDGTRLRARLVERADEETDEEQVDRKLGHKRRVADNDPTTIMCTSLYLDESEFAVVSSLPGRRLVKTRWSVRLTDTLSGAVDVFEESLAGLMLLEVDVGGTDALAAFTPPDWCGPEITQIEAFTGGRLAGSSYRNLADELTALRMAG